VASANGLAITALKLLDLGLIFPGTFEVLSLIKRRATKHANRAHGQRTQDHVIPAPCHVHLRHSKACCLKAMKNLRDVTGDQIPALPHTKKADIAARNQSQCSQRFLARDTPRKETCCIRHKARFSASIHSRKTRHQLMRKTKTTRPYKHRCPKQMSTHVLLPPEGATVPGLALRRVHAPTTGVPIKAGCRVG